MALNFTGRLQRPAAPEPTPRRTPLFLVICLGLATLLGVLVFIMALRAPPATSAPPSTPSAQPTMLGSSASPAAPVRAQASPPSARVQTQPAPASSVAPKAVAPPSSVKARMLQVLKRVPHGTITLSVQDDAGAEAYARQLADLFREAGWTADMSSVLSSGPHVRGLSAALGDTEADEAVRDAFDAADFILPPPPASAGVIQTPELFVGVPQGR